MPSRRLVLFHNAGSGHEDAARLRRRLERALAERDIEAGILAGGEGRSLPEALAEAAERAFCENAALVAVGGDGTVNVAADAAIACGLPLALVPVGTYNFVARAHGIPTSLGAALDLALEGTPRETRVGRMNGRRFLVNASIGLYARLLSERESLTRRLGRRRTVATLAAAVSALRAHRPLGLAIRQRGTTRRTTAATFIVGNNPLQLELVGVRDVPASEVPELAAVLLHPVGRLTLLAMIARGWRGAVHTTRELESSLFEEMVVDVPSRRARRITAALDGELVRETLPLRFAVDESPLMLIRPS